LPVHGVAALREGREKLSNGAASRESKKQRREKYLPVTTTSGFFEAHPFAALARYLLGDS
jgi:hypothetical protein